MSGFKKNTAVTGFPFALVSATDGSAITTGTVTGYYLLDGGTQGTIAGTATHEGNGQWSIPLTAGEMNGDVVGLLFTHASAIPVHFTIRTDTKIVSDLNDIAATSIVSAGAITTSGGAVSTVTSVTNGVTVTTNNDKTGYSISGTKTTLDALNDVAATDIVSAGAITTLSGAVVNVDTVDTCTTNTDMRGTDNALLAASAPTNFGDLAITVTTGQVTVGTNNDKTGYSISGTKTTLDALNDITTAQVNAEVLDVLTTDTFAEPGQATPAATASLKDKIGYIYKFLRNKKTSTSTTISVFNDDGTTVGQKSTISDDGTTYTEGEYTTGP